MKHRATSVVVALLLAGCAASSGNEPNADPQGQDSGPQNATVPETDPGVTAPPATTPEPQVTELPSTEPSSTEPAATDPAATDPAATDPAATDPAATDPAATDPAATDPAATDPATTDPATTDPAATDPPTTEPAPGTVITVPRIGRVAAAAPAPGPTVVHIGWALDGPWTPMAAWTGSGWMSADDGTDAFPDEAFSAVAVAGVGLSNPVTGLTYSEGLEEICPDGRQGPLLAGGGPSGDFAGDGPYRAVGVAGDWNVQPRGSRRSGLLSVDYQRIGESIVSAAGVDPVGGDVTDVVRADLDGDGVEEVFVTFEKITDGGGAPGDFVVIYARFPTGGNVVEQVLFEHYPQAWTSRPTVGTAGVLAVADLNGDGIMELALWSKFWDSSLAELFVFDGATSLTSVAVSGCSL